MSLIPMKTYCLFAGDTLAIRLRRRGPNNTDMDMTGQSVRIGFAWVSGYYEMTTDDGVTVSVIVDPDTSAKVSLISADIPPNVTSRFPAGRNTSYQVKVDDGQIEKTILAGQLLVTPSAFKTDDVVDV